MSWINDLKASVSWGDNIHATTIGGINCCRMGTPNSDSFHYWVAGQLTHRQKAYSDAGKVEGLTGATVSILYTDQQATTAQVKEAMVEAGMFHGFGCCFLSAELRAKKKDLLLKRQDELVFPKTGGAA